MSRLHSPPESSDEILTQTCVDAYLHPERILPDAEEWQGVRTEVSSASMVAERPRIRWKSMAGLQSESCLPDLERLGGRNNSPMSLGDFELDSEYFHAVDDGGDPPRALLMRRVSTDRRVIRLRVAHCLFEVTVGHGKKDDGDLSLCIRARSKPDPFETAVKVIYRRPFKTTNKREAALYAQHGLPSTPDLEATLAAHYGEDGDLTQIGCSVSIPAQQIQRAISNASPEMRGRIRDVLQSNAENYAAVLCAPGGITPFRTTRGTDSYEERFRVQKVGKTSFRADASIPREEESWERLAVFPTAFTRRRILKLLRAHLTGLAGSKRSSAVRERY